MKVKEESEKAGFKLNIQKTNIMASGPISSVQFIMASRWGNTGNRERLCVLQSLQMVTAPMKLKDLAPWQKSYDQPRQHIKKQRHYVPNKGPSSQGYGFFSSHVRM